MYVSEVYGSSGIKDFRSENDTVGLNISSTSDIISIPDCQKVGTHYICAITDSQGVSPVNYMITNQQGDTATAQVNIDNSIGEAIYTVTNQNSTVIMQYEVTDTGFNGNTACTGIEKIMVWWQGSNTDEIDFNDTSCTQSGTKELAITESGTAEFYLEITDRIGNTKTTQVQNITIDVSAPQAGDLVVLNGGMPLDVVAPKTDFVVDLQFDIYEDNLTQIVADISPITNNNALAIAYKNINVPVGSCAINDTESPRTYTCTIPSKVMNVNRQSINISLSLKDASGNTDVVVLEKSFTIDDIKPQVTAKSQYCDNEGVCYVKNGMNTFIFEMTKDNFEKRLIFYELTGASALAGAPLRVNNCTGSQCLASVNIDCDDKVELKIMTYSPSSQDDSGNKLPSYSTKFICDDSMPKITFLDWESDSKITNDTLIYGSTFSLLINVEEPDSKIFAQAYFDKIKNETIPAECKQSSPTSDLFNCTWKITPVTQGSYEAIVRISVSDSVNHTLNMTNRTLILGLKADNQTPDLLRATYTRTIPTSLNRAVLQLATINNIPVYAYGVYSIDVKSGKDVRLLSQQVSVDDCVLHEMNGNEFPADHIFSEIKVADIFKGVGNDHRLDFTFSSTFSEFNTFAQGTTVICNISAYVQEGKYAYTKPQALMLEFKFNLHSSQLDAPGEEYVKKIKDVERSTSSDYSNLISQLDKFMVAGQKLCTAKQVLDYAGMTGVSIQMAGLASSFIPGAQGISAAGAGIFTAYKNLNEKVWDPRIEDPRGQMVETQDDPIIGILAQACKFMRCELDWNNQLSWDEGLSNQIEGGLADLPFGAGKEWTGGLSNSELKNSLVMSAAKMCVPGVIYNLNRYKQMDCEYLECLKTYSASGLDVSQCELMKTSKTCSIIVGEFFEFPYVRLGKNLFSNMEDTIRMSYGHGLVAILNTIKGTKACEDPTSNFAIISCNVPYQLQNYLSAKKKTSLAESFYYEETRDFCKSAKCVGPQCYPSNSVFGIPLPQYVPSPQQKQEMDLMNRFGELQDSVYKLSSAHEEISRNHKVTEQASKYISQWNEEISVYNDKYKTSYPKINIDEDPTKAREQISNYLNNFNVLVDDPSDPRSKDPASPQASNPAIVWRNTIEKYESYTNKINSNELYIGVPEKQDPLSNALANREYSNAKDLTRLSKVLPFGAKVFDDPSLIPPDALTTSKNGVYYLKREGDVQTLYYTNYKDPAKPDGEQKHQAIIRYDSSGMPSEVLKLPTDETWLNKMDTSNLEKKLQDVKDYKKKIEDLNMDQAKKNYERYRMEQSTGVGMRLLLDQLGFYKFLTAEYWSDKWGPGKYITQLADAASPEIWKNQMCNPDNGVFFTGSDKPEGAVYSCNSAPGDGCKLVLTYGAERTNYTNGTYLYTVTYLVGTVPRDVEFNLYMRGATKSLKGFQTFKRLDAYKYDSAAEAFVSKVKYESICMQFNGRFPDPTDGVKEFCRPVREDIFRTGQPYVEEGTLGYPTGQIGTTEVIFNEVK